MSDYSIQNRVALYLESELALVAASEDKGTDNMLLLQVFAGMMVEMSFFFEHPDQSLKASLDKLSVSLSSAPWDGGIPAWAMPQPHVLDATAERGRTIVRSLAAEWPDCEFSFHEFILFAIRSHLSAWEDEGIPRQESLRLLIECAWRAMIYEVAAQELCDILIETKIAQHGWSLGDSISALSGAAGRKVAEALNMDIEMANDMAPQDVPRPLDDIVHVMTQEAIRLGTPAGSDWRFGLAANDGPANAPKDLVDGVDPVCTRFFSSVGVTDLREHAVCCAKAAGRMLAVAAGGDMPELAPVIAKPLAMAAMTETYRSMLTNI